MFGKPFKYQQKISLEGYTLGYLGSGIRKALVFDLYSAALYSNNIFETTQDAIELEVPKILVTNILTPLLSGAILSTIFKEALSKTHFGSLPAIKKDVDDIIQIFKKGKIARFDKFEFLTSPTVGFIAYQNGIKKYSCTNLLLAKAIFEVYLGSFHKNQDLPKSIVGV